MASALSVADALAILQKARDSTSQDAAMRRNIEADCKSMVESLKNTVAIREDEVKQAEQHACQARATIMFGDEDKATAAVIWMHGLGDTPVGWAELASSIQTTVPSTRWILPCAPENPVTCNGGMRMTSWMDLLEIPITTETKDNGMHLPESLAMIHKVIDDLVQGAMPSNRILLGGFSQGGALSLAATLKYPKPLAGACVLSGWCLKNIDVPSLAKTSPNKRTPFLVCHGDADQTVVPACGNAVRKALEDAGTPVEFHSYPGMAHGSCPQEKEHIISFINRVLS